MTARETFGVIVRAMGFGSILASVIDLGHIAAQGAGLPVVTHYPAAGVATSAGNYFIIGIAVILAAKPITRIIYGRDNSN